MYKDKEVKNVKDICFVNVWRKNIFDIYVTEYGTALTTILPISDEDDVSGNQNNCYWPFS
jgi:hypothetical protein